MRDDEQTSLFLLGIGSFSHHLSERRKKMRKLFTLGVLLLFGVTALIPSESQAFNSGTHIYIAERVFPLAFDKINLYYGSIAPDLSSYVNDPEDWPTAFCDTHYKFIKIPNDRWKLTPRAFAKGWQTHNEIWAADYYAHGTCKCFGGCIAMSCSYEGYVPTQAVELANMPEFEQYLNSPPYYELAHFAVEVAIDLLLTKNQDPILGLKLFWAAKYRSQGDVNLMVGTFVKDNKPPTKLTLEDAESNFQDLVISYATALALPDPYRMIALGDLGYLISQETIPPAKVQEILEEAMILCEEPDQFGHTYLEIIQSAIKGIRRNPGLIR